MIVRAAEGTPDIVAELRGVPSGIDEATAAREALAIGGVTPRAVVTPGDRDELARVVAAVDGAGAGVVALGLGRHRHLGHAPSRYDVALSTARLASVREYTPADMTVTVDAGMTIAALQSVLASEGQWLPVAPPDPAHTTIGGLIAADINGPFRATQGRVRDFVIGIAAVLVDGRTMRAGGKVVKNVAGYDLMKLLIGSLGTLAIVVEATFKVKPRPAAGGCMVLASADAERALALAAAIAERALGSLSATTRIPFGATSARPDAVIELAGIDADVAVERTRVLDLASGHNAMVVGDLDRADDAAPEVGAAVRDFPCDARHALVLRAAALPERTVALTRDLVGACSGTTGTCLVDARAGSVLLGLSQEADVTGGGRPDNAAARSAVILTAASEIAARHGAHLVVERWPLELADMVTVWSPLPSALPLMRRMKQAFDPRGTLAAGRFVGRL